MTTSERIAPATAAPMAAGEPVDPRWDALPELASLDVPPRVKDALRLAGGGPAAEEDIDASLDRVIAAIDAAVGRAVDDVLHHPAYQGLESAWRGLHHVVERVDFQENTQVFIWSCSKEELAADIEDSSDLLRTRAFGVIYTAEFGQFGGAPYSAVLADMAFDESPRDVRLLRAMGALAAMAYAPFFAAASPRLLRLGSWRELPGVQDAGAVFEGRAFTAWNAFRETEDSRYVGLLLPRFLLRRPYGAIDVETPFTYAERVAASGDGLLWGNPIFVLATRLAASFAAYRTLGAIVGDEPEAGAAATLSFDALGPRYVKPPLEASVTPRLEQSLRDVGLIALEHRKGSTSMFVASANSLQKPKQFGGSPEGREAALNYLLGTKFPYLFLACRIAHYLKVIERDTIGSQRSVEEVERALNEWLGQYVVDMDSASAAVRMRYPLRRAGVTVHAVPESPGWYRAEIRVRPHLKYLGSFFTLSTSAMLERR